MILNVRICTKLIYTKFDSPCFNISGIVHLYMTMYEYTDYFLYSIYDFDNYTRWRSAPYIYFRDSTVQDVFSLTLNLAHLYLLVKTRYLLKQSLKKKKLLQLSMHIQTYCYFACKLFILFQKFSEIDCCYLYFILYIVYF